MTRRSGSRHSFGQYLRRQRIEAGISLREAARRLEVSAVYLGEVERGVRPPLKEARWDTLLGIIPTLDHQTLGRLAADARPVQLDLRDAPPKYQDLALALARRIERENLSDIDFQKLSSILGETDE